LRWWYCDQVYKWFDPNAGKPASLRELGVTIIKERDIVIGGGSQRFKR